MRSTRSVIRCVLSTVVCLVSTQGAADVCQVPSAPYPTIQDAVDAPVCTEIELAAQTFEELVGIARDLEMRGVSSATTVIEGQVTVQGATTAVALENLTVDASASGVAGSFTEALLVEGGAEVSGSNIVVLNAVIDQMPIFGDGFESGDTTAWSAVTR